MQSFHSIRRLRRVILIPIVLIPLFLFSGLYIRYLDWRFSSRQAAITDFIISQLQPKYENISRTLVVGYMKREDLSWIQRELPGIKTALYSMDDPHAPLHVKANKGHEAMAYLSYIIDNYENLPDIVIFFHAHRKTWHNNVFLDNESAKTILQLDPINVIQSGYVNTRCDLKEGCAGHLKFDVPKKNLKSIKPEEKFLTSKLWKELHMVDTVPPSIEQPRYAQFAVSREAILAHPISRYNHYRDWLVNTELSDSVSGKIFEHSWQYIFGKGAQYCPDERQCLYKNYGILFESTKDLKKYRRKWRLKEKWWVWFFENPAKLERELDRKKLEATRRGHARKRVESSWLCNGQVCKMG